MRWGASSTGSTSWVVLLAAVSLGVRGDAAVAAVDGVPVAIDGAHLYAVACPSTTQCTASDFSGREVTFNPQSPGSPAVVSLGAGNDAFEGIACPSTSRCTAVGLGGEEVTFDPASPGSPAPVDIDTQGLHHGLTAVACPSVSQCTAVDQQGEEATFNPQSPGIPVPISLNVGGVGMVDIACPSTTLCVAISASDLVVTFSPTAPGTPTPRPFASDPRTGDSVACPSTTQCTAMDNLDREATFDPSSVTALTPSSTFATPLTGEMLGLACPSVSLCVSVGYGIQQTFNPSAPAGVVETVYDPHLLSLAVACPSTTQCTFVDFNGYEVTFAPPVPGGGTTPPATSALSVSLAGSGGGSVTGSGINCPGTCSASYPVGTVVPLSATVAAGSTFGGWSGGGCTGTGTCTITMNANQAVTATFNPITTPPTVTPITQPVNTPTLLTPTVQASSQHQTTLKPIAAATAFSLPSKKSCVSRRKFALHVRKVPHIKWVSAVITIDGKRVKTLKRSRITALVNLTGLPKGTFVLAITATASSGRTATGTRTYHTCVPKKQSSSGTPNL